MKLPLWGARSSAGMKKTAVSVSFLICALAAPLRAADPVDEVRRAETAFAKAFADRDQAAFFAMVLDDASFLSLTRTLSGKAQVQERWSRFFTGPKAPFSWGPERVVVNAAGTVGLSMGPVYDPDGKHAGNFSSVWLKQPNGSWKVLFDGPGSPVACVAGAEAPQQEGSVTADDGVKLRFRKAGAGPFTVLVPLAHFDDFKQLGDIATVVGVEPRSAGDLEAFRAHLKAEKVVLVAPSPHGAAAVLYAAEHPDRVSRLVLLGTAPAGLDATRLTMPVLGIGGEPALPNARRVPLAGVWTSDPVAVFGSIREFLRGGWPLTSVKVGAAEPR